MRCYTFSNMYLSSLQVGLQSAHAIHDMFIKYLNKHNFCDKGWLHLHDWASNHKTMILLNAGYSSEIRSLIELFSDGRNEYPFCEFREAGDALDGALTTVGIILPPRVYDRENIICTYQEVNNGIPYLTSVSGSDVFNYLHKSGARVTYQVPGVGYPVGLSEYDIILAQRISKYGLAK